MIFALHVNIWSYGMIYTVGVSGASGVEEDSSGSIFGEIDLKRIHLLESSQNQMSRTTVMIESQGQKSRSKVKVKSQGQKSRSKVKVKCQGQMSSSYGKVNDNNP